MTITESGPKLVEAADGDAPTIGRLRTARSVKVGWHVRVAGRWLLVVRVDVGPVVRIWFARGSMLTCEAGALEWTRNPAEQIAYMASLLPARDHYRPSRPLGTLFGGSARALDGGP